MEIINYKNLEWYVINETDKEKLLFLRDSFTNTQILKYFKGVVSIDSFYDVQFNNINNPWWRDSAIRSVLNSSFLRDLDKNDLNFMKTVVKLNDEEVITQDYVRLITKEEIKLLTEKIINTSRKFGYWTMSPCPYGLSDNKAREVCVSSLGDLERNEVVNSLGVRPVISLKKRLDSGLILSDEEEMIRELKRAISL